MAQATKKTTNLSNNVISSSKNCTLTLDSAKFSPALNNVLVMAGRKPPVLEPNPAVVTWQGPFQYEGLDLWRQALRREYDRQIAAQPNEVPERWVRIAQNKPDEAARNRYFNDFYSDLPSPVRRAWERESHTRWPRRWTQGPAGYLDVYANEDEIYYTRKAGRWSMGESQIRDMYDADFKTLSPGAQSQFRDRADAITDARGLVLPPGRNLKKPVRGVPANGPVQSRDVQREDLETMDPQMLGMLYQGHEWAIAASFGGNGSFGEAIVWRVTDQYGRTLKKIFLKRDRIRDDWTSNKERWLLWHMAVNFYNQVPNHLGGLSPYVPVFLGGRNGTATAVGRTWLEYAIYGDLGGLMEYYIDNDLVIPEPFAWYLLHCMAKALFYLERGHQDRNTPQGWRPMFHYDIKPQNILLDVPQSDGPEWCRGYPRPILADFGGADLYPNPNSPDQIPQHVRGSGTPRFSSFEMFGPWHQTTSNIERATGPHRRSRRRHSPVAPEHPNISIPSPLPPRATPYKQDPLPTDNPVRLHSSIHSLGIALWCVLALTHSPAGQLFAWRGAGHGGRDTRIKPNAYPAWWDRLPGHAARRPWPWRVAKRAEREKWAGLVERGWAWGQEVRLRGGRKRLRPVPRVLDELGKRPREWVGGGSGVAAWAPYGVEGQLRPGYSARLVELVYKCMSPRVEDRPTPAQLWDETERAMNDITAKYPDGSGRRPQGLLMQPDKFPIGYNVLNSVWSQPAPDEQLF
ncbi:kinase-like protein [Diplodia corticola]|uniref:Kinase-like protein n=1 Tax=Diplodia corticola TaxID=236234 RepID=A0A1J9R270_9PEZI|nr:kinase-like protein [Diplodia corticola]OJD35494.1 kinase-like protein [Diplodia corticola]